MAMSLSSRSVRIKNAAVATKIRKTITQMLFLLPCNRRRVNTLASAQLVVGWINVAAGNMAGHAI